MWQQGTKTSRLQEQTGKQVENDITTAEEAPTTAHQRQQPTLPVYLPADGLRADVIPDDKPVKGRSRLPVPHQGALPLVGNAHGSQVGRVEAGSVQSGLDAHLHVALLKACRSTGERGGPLRYIKEGARDEA